ncbi:SAG-related sequence SRS43 [Toxoplasma gondii TgCatPRC2]|uniref:SAG-related sequence SRS43 n=4 Tax=Toxoplasma gondii TaxID=5811 RepID=A0A151HQD0_TOXGO|nr:SAG-related sequence SRS43 [Toxoplasma gondii ME49]EPT26767.1 SAG-related sequence SRS43 [Toxoplasma gondii ME49]KFG46035.1 SAG-related sequence SRS43 [Toxoplasma gondii GAB2-2007-GAL-DOM2]KYF42374.1 SAG-related sequence SRS43 [Toxoplasma gondii ARI]KYK71542.1 SAG-related sequence SRS43 [Toxoplasma gondii TgCatPRC2]|eukprot:XP_002368908.1 SAG-related sequence SRS43 [Toxoplasma gondii ME49]
MMQGSRMQCLGSQSAATISQMSPRKWPRTFRMGLTLMVLFAATSTQYGYSPSSTIGGALPSAGTAVSDCVADTNKGTTTCKCLKEDTAPKPLSATMSEDLNVLQVTCEKDLKCAPDDASGQKVCPENTTSLDQCCTTSAGSDACINVSDIFAGSQNGLQWDKDTTTTPTSTTRKLTVPKESFPYTDRKFVVGCLKNTRNPDQCKVTVTVTARATAKKDQTVTCAYGASSNAEAQTITLSPSQNSFTLVCGTEGQILPSTYTKNFCVSTDKDITTACELKAYTSIIETYHETWWKETDATKAYTLQIPPTDFPEEAASIVVGCQKKAAQSSNERDNSSETHSLSACQVKVTIEGSPNSSGAAAMSGTKVSLTLTAVAIISAFAHAM